MSAAINVVVLSGRIDPLTDLDAGAVLELQLGPLPVVVPHGKMPSGLDYGDEVLIEGYLDLDRIPRGTSFESIHELAKEPVIVASQITVLNRA